jgi:hypothetical protein
MIVFALFGIAVAQVCETLSCSQCLSGNTGYYSCNWWVLVVLRRARLMCAIGVAIMLVVAALRANVLGEASVEFEAVFCAASNEISLSNVSSNNGKYDASFCPVPSNTSCEVKSCSDCIAAAGCSFCSGVSVGAYLRLPFSDTNRHSYAHRLCRYCHQADSRIC